MNEPTKRFDVQSLYLFKLDMLARMKEIEQKEKELEDSFHSIGGYTPYHIEKRLEIPGINREEKCVDAYIWRYLINLFQLKRYMLCTEYEQYQNKIDHGDMPIFTVENAKQFLDGLRDVIYLNVKELVHKVFEELTTGTYRTGSSYSAPRKKRNNNGIDKNFILHTCDYSYIITYWSDRPTITDDLEKVCYLLSGQPLPETTIKDTMRRDKLIEADNGYFKIKIYSNGNTHYTLDDSIREKLNRYGPRGAYLGENIKIKIVNNFNFTY